MKAQNNLPQGAGLSAKVAYRTAKIDDLNIFYGNRDDGRKRPQRATARLHLKLLTAAISEYVYFWL